MIHRTSPHAGGKRTHEPWTTISSAPGARSRNPFLNTAQAAHYLGFSARQLERMRSRGDGPPFRRHCRFIRYHVDDLIAWSRGTMMRGGDD